MQVLSKQVGVVLTNPVLLGDQAVDLSNNPLKWPMVDGMVGNVFDRRVRPEITEISCANCVLVHSMKGQEQLEREVERQRKEIESLRSELKKERETSVLKERFTALIAHEFGTPLSVIRAKSDILDNHLERLSREKISQYLHNIEAQVGHMVDLMDDLVFVNRAYSAREMFQPEPLDLKPFCQTLLDQTMSRWTGRDVVFTCTGHCSEILIDPRLVRYIVSNLVSNALKYSPAAGDVRMDIHGTDDKVIFSVSDEGIGIPADEVDRIFNPLYRASNATDFNGMGLGLALVKTSVEACGGTINVQSELGKGTTFIVSLPQRSE